MYRARIAENAEIYCLRHYSLNSQLLLLKLKLGAKTTKGIMITFQLELDYFFFLTRIYTYEVCSKFIRDFHTSIYIGKYAYVYSKLG